MDLQLFVKFNEIINYSLQLILCFVFGIFPALNIIQTASFVVSKWFASFCHFNFSNQNFVIGEFEVLNGITPFAIEDFRLLPVNIEFHFLALKFFSSIILLINWVCQFHPYYLDYYWGAFFLTQKYTFGLPTFEDLITILEWLYFWISNLNFLIANSQSFPGKK